MKRYVLLLFLLLFSSVFGTAVSNSLDQLTIHSLQEMFSEEGVDLKVKNLIPLTSDPSRSKWTYEINGEWILQLYRDSNGEKKLEERLLDCIDETISVQLPKRIYRGEKTSFIIYRKIRGKTLDEIKLENLTAEEQCRLACSLANFMVEFQSTLSCEEAKQIGLPHESSQLISEQFPRVPSPDLLNEHLLYLLPKHDPDLLPLWRVVYDSYRCIIEEPTLFGVSHNDLHFGNLLIDPNTKQLIGVIDFGEANWGHVYREFRHFYSYQPEFMERVAISYARLKHLPEEEVIRYAYLFRLYREFTNLWKTYAYPKIATDGDRLSTQTLREFLKSPKAQTLFCLGK